MDCRKIGDVARELRISERRIREYEKAGLIRPRREPSTTDRLFNNRDVAQIRIIRRLIQEQGFSLKAIKLLIQYAPCWELTDCPRRKACPAFRNPDIPCYELKEKGIHTLCPTTCEHCPICHHKSKSRPPIIILTCD